jgi:hypothetical protein
MITIHYQLITEKWEHNKEEKEDSNYRDSRGAVGNMTSGSL